MNLENFKEFEIEKLDVIFGGNNNIATSDRNGFGYDPSQRTKHITAKSSISNVR